MDTAELRFSVPSHLEGERLDRAAVQLAEGMSRARVKKAIEDGAVRVNGRVRAKGAVVSEGDVITIAQHAAMQADAPAMPEPGAPLSVRFEGPNVVVVSKPAGQPTAPLRGGELGTLANAIVAQFPEVEGIGYAKREPGLVHRLDTETSGLVVVARSHEAFEELRDALKQGLLKKKYELLCDAEGLPDRGTIAFPLANHPKDQRRVYPCIHPRDVARYAPRPASTSYIVKKRVGAIALVEASVDRAIRHQIRAHFAAIGHPLLGDTLYGGRAVEGLDRHALHASSVRYDGGDTVMAFDVAAPLPADMASLIAE